MSMRAVWLGSVGIVFAALGAACSSPPPPQPAGAMVAPSAPAPDPYASEPDGADPYASDPAPAATVERPPDIIIHEADVFGEIHARAGSTVQMLSLVATRTPPGPGVKAVLMRGVEAGGDTEWVAIADVTVQKELDATGQMHLTITDEKKDVLVGGRKVNHFVKGVRVKLHWEY